MNTVSTSAPIVMQGLTKTFNNKCALNELSAHFPSGGITALLGENGAGKTTLINCALGLLRPSKGTINVLGSPAGSITVKRRIGVMLQDSDLPDLLSAREHIALFSTYYPHPIEGNELINLCQLNEFADVRYKHLSGGQKRRVQFALAIVGRPELVFLDEPTTGLDIEARRLLWATITDLRNQGTTIILTTHYLEEADALADHILVMADGKLIANSAASEFRAAVGGAVIRCQTTLSDTQLTDLSGVQTVRHSGRFVEILSRDGTQTLRQLLPIDPSLHELTVNKPSLEDAFTQLIKTPTH